MSMMLQILVSALLFAWLAYAAISHRLTSKAKTSDEMYKLEPLAAIPRM
jgi:hypothetical protein